MFLTVAVSLFLCLSTSLSVNVKTTKFVKEQLQCSLAERISHGCSEEVTTPTAGLLHCVSLCGQKEDCIGASRDDNGTCLHHQVCTIESCQEDDLPRTFMAKYCGEGSWNSSSLSCSCVNGMSGARCDIYPRNCAEFYQAGYDNVAMIVTINPNRDGSTLHKVSCDLKKNPIKTTIAINRGKVIFNRTWEDYAKGFYDDENNFWAGLRAWYELCKDGCNVMTSVLFEGGGFWRTQTGFKVQNENSSFQFTWTGTFEGRWGKLSAGIKLGSCMSSIKWTPFSTWDRDNDGDSTENCAARAGSGWWYKSGCDNPCNLLGLGYDHWSSTPQYQHFSALGIDPVVFGPRNMFMRIIITEGDKS